MLIYMMPCYDEKLTATSCLQVRLSPQGKFAVLLSEELQVSVKLTTKTRKERGGYGGLGVQDQLWLHELEASWSDMSPHLKTEKGKTTTEYGEEEGREKVCWYLQGTVKLSEI